MVNNRFVEKRELSKENDLFGTYDKAVTILDIINKLSDGNGYPDRMISLYGPWGSGKTTIMDYIYRKIKRDDFVPIWFDAWKYEKDDNLALSILHCIAYELKNHFVEGAKEGFESLFKVLKSFTAGFNVGIPGLGFDASKVYDRADKEFKEEDLESLYQSDEWLREEFDKIIPKKKKIIIFLDDLDRCENDHVLNLLSAIYNVFSKSDRIICIAGIDKEAILKALRYRYRRNEDKAEKFLEKIFTMDFTVTYKDPLDKIIEMNFPVLQKTMKNFFVETNTTNPRRVIRIINKYNLFKDIVSKDDDNISYVFKSFSDETLFYHQVLLYLINLTLNYSDCIATFQNQETKVISYSENIKYIRNGDEYLIGVPKAFILDDHFKVEDVLNDHEKIMDIQDSTFTEHTITSQLLRLHDGSNFKDGLPWVFYTRVYNIFVLSLRFAPRKKHLHVFRRMSNSFDIKSLITEMERCFTEEEYNQSFSEGEYFMMLFSKYLFKGLNHNLGVTNVIYRVEENSIVFSDLYDYIINRL